MPFIVSKKFFDDCLKLKKAVIVKGKYYIVGLGEVIFNTRLK